MYLNSAHIQIMLLSFNLRELRALPQGRWITHVMAIGVGRQWRVRAKPGSVFNDSYTDLRPQVSETRTVARLVPASAPEPCVPCRVALGASQRPLREAREPESTQRARREHPGRPESTQRAFREHSERPESTQRSF